MQAIEKSLYKKKSIFIQVYDMENEIGAEIEITLSILKLEGMSQLNMNNQLYLCGSESSDLDHEGARFIKIDPLKQPVNLSYLISCSSCHYYPSITQLKNEYIFVIGGKNSTKCEVFNVKKCKWSDLVDLPEERYGAVTTVDEVTNSLYVFGGYNSTSQKIHGSVLKLNLKQGKMLRWETIVTLSNNALLLTKSHSGVCRLDENKVMIVGGKTNQEESCDDIIEVTFIRNSLNVNNKIKLNKISSFETINYGCELNGNFFFIDNESMVHKISRYDQRHSYRSFFETSRKDGDYYQN